MPVRVRQELAVVTRSVLQDYVSTVIRVFGEHLQQHVPGMTYELLQQAALEAGYSWAADGPETALLDDAAAVIGLLPEQTRQLQLNFKHECLALGFNETARKLCQHNTRRRCSTQFSKKYMTTEHIAAACGAVLQIVAQDLDSRIYSGALPEVQVFVVEGSVYDANFLTSSCSTAGVAADSKLSELLERCSLLKNKKGQPLLEVPKGCRADADGRLLLQVQDGSVELPAITFTESSEALLSGRKPPFRLVARAKQTQESNLQIKHAVSEPFVVATRRVKANKKIDIPSAEDPVSRIEHLGGQTVKKLADLQAAAAEQEITLPPLDVDLLKISKAGHFKQLVLRAEVDGHLKHQLITILRMSKDKWAAAAVHAKRTVVPDTKMRAWTTDQAGLPLGLLFSCQNGMVQLGSPAGAAAYCGACPQLSYAEL
eukprot:GHUV01029929.1.p1 GENE.GHUV01029929.1~~GHUV01029929.1.p1  ORF type:complete len:428 (+),score=139.02 GHUV01029929.1:209-1492(+)